MARLFLKILLTFQELWYILRVSHLTAEDFRPLPSKANQFLRKSIFPVIPWWSIWILPPKAQGGLGVIYIQTQASALYFRCLQPLLTFDQSTIDAHPVSNLLSLHIRNINQCEFHSIPLLFPCSRSQGLRKQRSGPVDMLYKAVDMFPRSFDVARLNAATALVLPLQAAFYVPASSTLSLLLRVKNMLVSDVFQYNNTRLNFLHWKDTRDPSLLQWKRTPQTVFRGL